MYIGLMYFFLAINFENNFLYINYQIFEKNQRRAFTDEMLYIINRQIEIPVCQSLMIYKTRLIETISARFGFKTD